jgi:hypothetical protein
MSTCPSVCLSVCPSPWNNLASTGRIFMKSGVWCFFENHSRKVTFYWNLARITDTSRKYLSTFVISHWILFRIRSISNKSCRESRKHILYSITFWISCHLRDNMKKYGKAAKVTDDNVIRSMRCARLITKATHTHTHTHTLLSECKMCNTFTLCNNIFLSTSKAVSQTRRNFTLYVSCCIRDKKHCQVQDNNSINNYMVSFPLVTRCSLNAFWPLLSCVYQFCLSTWSLRPVWFSALYWPLWYPTSNYKANYFLNYALHKTFCIEKLTAAQLVRYSPDFVELKYSSPFFVRVSPCILYIKEQWRNTNKCTVLIKNDVLTVLPTCFGLKRTSSGQYFTEITENYNMYTQLKCSWCLYWGVFVESTTTPQHTHTPGIRICYFNLLTPTNT